ncbi:retron Ec48 family effector membrane protein [Lysobacter sp. H23M47]|uniref:retron Ec48 family effector membrane protein n=1 Tax=Lysobacter sp. H23M47 TaxID=2781024 RepID=UPI001880CBAF|nr:retron Ec48 family effector membrane protein [Lysobacter sp. H23M47]QOW25511.1 hypothetical protein INQ43_05715 [Lysobacter sp. H23M47]
MSIFLKRSVVAVDDWLKPIRILGTVFGIAAAFATGALLITILNVKYYWESYSFCMQLSCLAQFPDAFRVQLDLLGAGGKLATLVALVLGPYAALKGYLSTASAEAFGNHIAHLNFFESFIRAELDKRERISKGAVDIYSLYRLMFPEADGRAIHASPEFLRRVGFLCNSIEASSQCFSSAETKFRFDVHRRAITQILLDLYITQHNSPRIDFLEAEDQLLDFLCMLSRVFGERGAEVAIPKRLYR